MTTPPLVSSLLYFHFALFFFYFKCYMLFCSSVPCFLFKCLDVYCYVMFIFIFLQFFLMVFVFCFHSNLSYMFSSCSMVFLFVAQVLLLFVFLVICCFQFGLIPYLFVLCNLYKFMWPHSNYFNFRYLFCTFIIAYYLMKKRERNEWFICNLILDL